MGNALISRGNNYFKQTVIQKNSKRMANCIFKNKVQWRFKTVPIFWTSTRITVTRFQTITAESPRIRKRLNGSTVWPLLQKQLIFWRFILKKDPNKRLLKHEVYPSTYFLLQSLKFGLLMKGGNKYFDWKCNFFFNWSLKIDFKCYLISSST